MSEFDLNRSMPAMPVNSRSTARQSDLRRSKARFLSRSRPGKSESTCHPLTTEPCR